MTDGDSETGFMPETPLEDAKVEASDQGDRPKRDPTFDILKGIAITEVVLLHVSGFSSRNFATKDSWLWWALSMGVAVLQVCVPTFFISSAIVAAMSAARKETLDWGAYYGRRFAQTLWPYVLWTFIYLGLRYFVAKAPGDLKIEESTLLGQSFTTPHVWAPDYVGYTLLWGKSQFHMYFLAVLMQFIAIFPLIFLAIRRTNLNLCWLFGISAALQGLVYWLNANFMHLKTPASTVIWYLVPLTMGVAIGLRWKDWPTIWRSWRWPLLFIGLIGARTYLYLRGLDFAGQLPKGLGWAFNGGFVLYTIALGLATVALSYALKDKPKHAGFWTMIGERSLAIFFIHPVVLQFLGSPRARPFLDRLPISALFTFLIVAATTWILADLLYRLRLNRLLFGR